LKNKFKKDKHSGHKGLLHLRKNVTFLGLLFIPPITFTFAVVYYIQGKSLLLASVLAAYGFISLVAVIIMYLKPDSGKVVRHLIASVMLLNNSLVYLTQIDSHEQFVWFVTFPVFFFLVTGFKNGWIYTSVLAVVFIFGYRFPYLLGHTPDLPLEVMIHGILAFSVMVALVSYFQYRIEKYETKMEKIAFYDHLTGAMSRHWMNTRLQEEIQTLHRKQRSGQNQLNENYFFSVILFDMDKFKTLNDTYGHSMGDEVLVQSIKSVIKHLRASDFVARWGGEEFLIFLRSTPVEGAVKVAEKIRTDIMANQFYAEKIKISVTASFGVAEYQPAETLESLVHRADICLYKAKSSGRNRVVHVA